ncbi:MAG TPA: nuclear transport factor 2 family protein [Actinomycetota bacterium]|nr:nuclear transport factor 2 family protein [Actinomycetota bacterium]
MASDRAPDAVVRYWEALERKDLEGATAFLDERFVEDWPQSGERIVGVPNWLRMATQHPTFPDVTVTRITGHDDFWAVEADFRYPGTEGTWRVCALNELSDGRIARIVEYFGAPFEAADWRKDLVQRI